MPTIKANGAEFYYEVNGKGPPLIFISGYTRDNTLWIPILDFFTPYFKVITFDNRAVGNTKDDGRPFSIDLMADDVISLAEALNLKRPHIVGGSMGGCIAQSIGSRYSDKIGKLAILISSAKWRLAMLFGIETLLNMRKAKVKQEYIIDTVLSSVFSDKFFQDSRKVDFFRKLLTINTQSVEDQERQFNALKQFDGRKQLSKIKAPTLIINGIQDVLALPEESQFLAENIPNSKWISCNCGHGCTVEIPEELSNHLLDFLRT